MVLVTVKTGLGNPIQTAKMKPFLKRRGLPCNQEETKTNYTNQQVLSSSKDNTDGSSQRARKRRNKKIKLPATTLSQTNTGSETCNVYVKKKNNNKIKDIYMFMIKVTQRIVKNQMSWKTQK